jgi:2-iminoacetate synthase
MTLSEYLQDYASEDTKEKGIKVIEAELENIPSEKVKALAKDYIAKIKDGKRDFRF